MLLCSRNNVHNIVDIVSIGSIVATCGWPVCLAQEFGETVSCVFSLCPGLCHHLACSEATLRFGIFASSLRCPERRAQFRTVRTAAKKRTGCDSTSFRKTKGSGKHGYMLLDWKTGRPDYYLQCAPIISGSSAIKKISSCSRRWASQRPSAS